MERLQELKCYETRERNSIYILETLQDLGFVYHIDEPSRDEPFIIPVRGRDFVTVPYTFHLNDIVSFPFVNWNPAAYEQALRDEFDLTLLQQVGIASVRK